MSGLPRCFINLNIRMIYCAGMPVACRIYLGKNKVADIDIVYWACWTLITTDCHLIRLGVLLNLYICSRVHEGLAMRISLLRYSFV